MEGRSCEVCGIPALQSCSSCHSSFYCSKGCQKKDWKGHKSSCIPYSIEVHPVYGRYLVATRDIKAGEIILRESAIAIGPRAVSKPLCLGCHKGMVNKTYSCSKCNYPLCSSSCEKSTLHEAECHIFSKVKWSISLDSANEISAFYERVLPLRCLLLKYTDPKKWQLLNYLQDNGELHGDEWKQRIRINIINYFKQAIHFKGVDEDEIFKVCGVLQTNSFELRQPEGSMLQFLFHKISIMAHDCAPNTENIHTPNAKVYVRSTRPIAKGTSITTSYANLLWNTLQRRANLQASKFFDCTCQRCCDATELGSHLSTLLCSQCGGEVLSTAPLDSRADWQCLDCNYTIQNSKVRRNHDILCKTFTSRDRSQIEPLESLMEACRGKLHPHHQILVEAKWAWLKFCGNHPECRYKDLSKVALQTKISYCHDLMQVADALFPDKSSFRGFLLYELHASLKTLAKKLLSFGAFNNERTEDYMNEAHERLEEAKQIFTFEDEMETRGFKDKLLLLEEDLRGL